MEITLKIIGGIVVAGLVYFLAILLYPLAGMLSAEIVAHFFPNSIAYVLSVTHIPNAAELGVILGFLSGFFRSIQTNTNNA